MSAIYSRPPRIDTAAHLSLLRARKARWALAVYFHTGYFPTRPSPLLRSARLVWSSTAVPGTLLANH